jgi:hypothetical protein
VSHVPSKYHVPGFRLYVWDGVSSAFLVHVPTPCLLVRFFFVCLFVCLFFGEFSNSSKTSEEMLSLLDSLQKYLAT